MKRTITVVAVVVAALGALVLGGQLTKPASENLSAQEAVRTYLQISAEDALEKMNGDEPFVLLDVRTVEEYAEVHIEGAILIPDYELAERADAELEKGTTILVYCRSGGRSAGAAQTLADMGYEHVYDMGGILSWPYEVVSSK